MARTQSQPIWAGDVAACLQALVDRDEDLVELAGPERLSHRQLVERALEAFGRPRPLVELPTRAVLAGLTAYEALTGPVAFATRDEADLLAATMLTERGTTDAEKLGVAPRRLAEVLA
jgi:uncharacterized protein YbjT (DUF2867 family)